MQIKRTVLSDSPFFTFYTLFVDKISRSCYYGASIDWKGTQTMDKIKIKLFSDAYFSSGMYRLPDEDGNDF